jgi:Tol biopolymer transport system component
LKLVYGFFLPFLVFFFIFLGRPGAFGLNKVQYERFNWRSISTQHFDLYFYQGGDSLAFYAADHIEQMYDSVSAVLGHRLRRRVPIILHNTHAQFEQTNVLRMPIPEAVGGFTEVFKNRIVLPFDGSRASFYHVLHHELTHAIMFDFFHSGGGMALMQRLSKMPLWVSEGLAEYASLGWDLESEFYMIDAVSYGAVPSPTRDFGGFMAYKGGQNFFFFVEESFGKGSVKEIFRLLRAGYTLETAFEKTTQTSLEESGELWLRELRRIYWPELGKRDYAKSIGRKLTDKGKDLSRFNLSPVLSPDAKYIAYFSDRGNYEGIWIMETATEKVLSVALESGYGATHESFQSFSSALSWSPDSKTLLFTAKQKGRNVIQVLDATSGKILKTYRPDFELISSPVWHPNHKTIAFAGMRNGQKDIWTLNTQDGTSIRQTSTTAAPDRPAFSPSGEFLVFEQKYRNDTTTVGHYIKSDVFIKNFKTGELKTLSSSPWDSKMPTFVNDSLVAYVSNRSGISNIYLHNLKNDSLWALSNILSGALSPSFAKDTSLMVFTLFEAGGWDIWLIKDPLNKRRPAELPKTHFIERAENPGEPFFKKPDLGNFKSYKDSSKSDTAAAEGVVEGALRRRPEPAQPPGFSEDDLFLDPEATASKKDADPEPEDSDLNPTEEDRPVDSTLFNRADAGRDSNSGQYNIKPYFPDWSLDQAVALAGFDNVNGLGGQGFLSFTDLMGDQELQLMFLSGGGNFDNISAQLGYNYLPWRTDVGASVFHIYRQGYEYFSPNEYEVLSGYPADSLPANAKVWEYYGDRHYGGSVRFVYPFSIFSRLEFDTDFSWRTRQYLEVSSEGQVKVNETLPEQTLNTLGASLGWSFDNAQWGHVGPVNGGRYYIGASVVPPDILQDELAWYVLNGDFRKYFRFYKKFTFATRFSAGTSEPISGYRNPHRFRVGGDNMTLNWHFNEDNYRRNMDDVYFSSWETPLRGYRYHDFSGTRKALLNLEFRYPFIREFSFDWPIPLAIRNVTGVLFNDVGGAWDDREFEDNIGHGWGWGMRLNLGIVVLRYSKAWSNHSMGNFKHESRSYWSLGAEF